MEITLKIPNTENIENLNDSDRQQIRDIMSAIISSGGCNRVRGGQTIIHFDADGVFQKVELKYFPWVRRK
jgi:hypothetical protein